MGLSRTYILDSWMKGSVGPRFLEELRNLQSNGRRMITGDLHGEALSWRAGQSGERAHCVPMCWIS
jgi:hypothetical protein